MSDGHIAVTIKGISPLLMHRYPMVEIKGFEKLPMEEQAEYAAYRDEETRELYVPGIAVQRAIVGAATFSKGKGRASLEKVVAACVLINPERLGLGIKDYKIDSRRVVIPATKGAIIRHRPRIDNWTVAFSMEYEKELLSEKDLREIVNNCGSRVGLLDFRPARKGPFGRFMVIEWKSK